MKTYTLITGASRGIGLEIAKVCAKADQNLILVARDLEALEKAKTKLSQNTHIDIHIVSLDLSLPRSAERLFNEVQTLGLEVDILINNAGYGLHGSFLDLDPAKDLGMLQLNMITLTELTRFFGKAMKEKKKGRILNVASVAGFLPGPYMSTYYATKAYVLSLSEALHEELKNDGVSVTTLCPGPTVTNFFEEADAKKLRIVDSFLSMPAASVAKEAFEGLMKGRRLTIPGAQNKMSVQAPRFLPRSWVAKISKLTMTK